MTYVKITLFKEPKKAYLIDFTGFSSSRTALKCLNFNKLQFGFS